MRKVQIPPFLGDFRVWTSSNPKNQATLRQVRTPKSMKDRILKETKLWAPIIIALCALFLTIYQGDQTRLHNQLSVKPSLFSSFYYNDKSAGYTLDSRGLGPAIIKWVEVQVDGQARGNWFEVESALGLSVPSGSNGTHSNPYTGIFLMPGDKMTLYAVGSENNIAYLRKNYERVRIKICYCSIYAEQDKKQCWQASNFFENIKRTCDMEPEVIFPRIIQSPASE